MVSFLMPVLMKIGRNHQAVRGYIVLCSTIYATQRSTIYATQRKYAFNRIRLEFRSSAVHNHAKTLAGIRFVTKADNLDLSYIYGAITIFDGIRRDQRGFNSKLLEVALNNKKTWVSVF